jgi:hypothetical protein
VLGVADLGMGVQVAADGDQPFVQRVRLEGDPAAPGLVVGWRRHHLSVSHRRGRERRAFQKS